MIATLHRLGLAWVLLVGISRYAGHDALDPLQMATVTS